MTETEEKKGEKKIKVTRKGKAQGGGVPALYAETMEIKGRKPGSKAPLEPEEDIEYNKPTGMTKNIKTTLEKWADTLEKMGNTRLADTLKRNEKYPSLAKANIVVVYGDAGNVDRVMNEDTGEDITGIMKPTYEEAPAPVQTAGGEEGKSTPLILDPNDPDISPATSPRQIDPILMKKMGYKAGGAVKVTRTSCAAGGSPKDSNLTKDKKIKIKDSEKPKAAAGMQTGGEIDATATGPANLETGLPGNLAEGNATQKKMTAAQIQKELGVTKPGDIATVYDVTIRDGKLVDAVMNDAETQRFSRIISQTSDKNPPVGAADERNKLSLQYSDKPNVGFASGAGFQAGGEVADATTETAEPGGGPPEPAEGEATMKGPFESYAKVEGVDLDLVRQGNTLFSSLNEALSGAGAEDPQTYLDELKQFAKDVEAKRSESVKSMNDTTLAASYKDMAADARDLISAFENMIADTGSDEMRAGKSSASEPVPVPVPEEARA